MWLVLVIMLLFVCVCLFMCCDMMLECRSVSELWLYRVLSCLIGESFLSVLGMKLMVMLCCF